MKAELIGYYEDLPDAFFDTEVWEDSEFRDRVDFDYYQDMFGDSWSPSDILAEAAGRLCYDSYHLPRESTRDNHTYLANLQRQQHRSVLGHSSFTFLMTGVSRALTHELVRHSHFRFSQESQRFIDLAEREDEPILPPLLQQHMDEPRAKALAVRYSMMYKNSKDWYRQVQQFLGDKGYTRKETNDAGRYALPQGSPTKLVVTGNGQAWLEFLEKREGSHAAEEIRLLAGLVAKTLRSRAPATFPRAGDE